MQRAVLETSLSTNLAHLSLLAQADAEGRITTDKSRLIETVDLFREYCREQGCLDTPYEFPDGHSRYLYFHSQGRMPDTPGYDDCTFDATLMSGLPASGKDEWIRRNAPTQDVVSLDALRLELGVSPTENQGTIITTAKEKAKKLLRTKTPFVWNATNITRHLRDPLVSMFADYGARVRIVYVEAPLRELMKRNGQRQKPVPNEVIMRLAQKLDLPSPVEATSVQYEVW